MICSYISGQSQLNNSLQEIQSHDNDNHFKARKLSEHSKSDSLNNHKYEENSETIKDQHSKKETSKHMYEYFNITTVEE